MAAQQQQAAIANLQVNLASGIYTELVAEEYRRAREAGQDDQVQINLGAPASIARQAADVLLVELGLVQPVSREAPPPADVH